jgi:hypothetical protein
MPEKDIEETKVIEVDINLRVDGKRDEDES